MHSSFRNLYFHECILAKLLGDDTLSLTFCNYEHPNSTNVPWFYSTALSPYLDLCTIIRDASIDHPDSITALYYGRAVCNELWCSWLWINKMNEESDFAQ
ncbi:hypothetical protein KP509_21G050600 [Ceratopteris richardii]|uniref:Uncharacterized protein n=1 Tax=Ceratopteris richardii TaxID=49495 RepID=A0A8T2SBA4_CERRI|nr:hypothetical protein KP509_21G050600 [Ceratopteris richardii]